MSVSVAMNVVMSMGVSTSLIVGSFDWYLA